MTYPPNYPPNSPGHPHPPHPQNPGQYAPNQYPPPMPAPVLGYRGPAQPGYGEGGVWSDGPLLVMEKWAQLPHGCLKCGAPAAARLRRKLTWHPQALYFLILFPGLLIYAIVAICVQKRATVDVPLCELHLAKRKRGLMIGWGIAGLGLLAIVLGCAGLSERRWEDAGAITLVAGILLVLVGAVAGTVLAQPVNVDKIDDRYVWLKRVAPQYLATLPPARE